MNSGYLITFEGGEGGGKTTQTARLKEKLEAAGKEVIALREPGGTVVSEQIREVVLSAKNTGIVDMTEVLLFQAARSQIYREVVLPALEKGTIILMDRSRDSSVVYQGIVRGMGKELIEQLNTISTKDTYPALTILLDLPVETGINRKIADNEITRFELEDQTFHQKVRDAYVQLANEDKKRWRVIDATQAFDQVSAEIWKEVSQKIGLTTH